MLLIISLIPAAVLTTLSFFVFYAVDKGTKSAAVGRFGRILGVAILVVVVVILTTTTLLTVQGHGKFALGGHFMHHPGDGPPPMEKRMERMMRAMEYMKIRAELENRLEVLQKSHPELAQQMRNELGPILER